MVDGRNSGEKKKKKPIRNTPKGFKSVKDYVENISKDDASGQEVKVAEKTEKSEKKEVEKSSKQKTEEIFSPPVEEKPSSSKRHSLREHRNKLIAISVVAAVLLVIFVFKPNILGLGVYDQGQLNDTINNFAGDTVNEDQYSINDLGSTIEQLKSEVSSGNDKLNEFLQNDINSLTENLASCLTEKSSLQDTYDQSTASLQDELDQKTQELDTLQAEGNQQCTDTESELTSLQDSFDLLVLNSAKNICCKKKIDNMNINSYDVVDDKIVCLEEGNKTLDCFN